MFILELQPVRVHFVPETEWSAKVPEQHLLVLTLADGSHHVAIHHRLVLLALGRWYIFLQEAKVEWSAVTSVSCRSQGELCADFTGDCATNWQIYRAILMGGGTNKTGVLRI